MAKPHFTMLWDDRIPRIEQRDAKGRLTTITVVADKLGEIEFVLMKGSPTLVCALFVLLHKNFRYARGAIAVGFAFYFALAMWHLVLQIQAWDQPPF